MTGCCPLVVRCGGLPVATALTPNPQKRTAISEQTIWLIAVGLVALDLAVFMIPVVPLLAAYVLVARPPWFKTFVDDLYDEQ